MADLIDRQMAIDIVRNRVKRFTTACVLAVTEIEQLPSAQPPASECWRCNCKKMDTVHGLDGTVYTQDKDKQGWTGQLPSAQPQRKKGKWLGKYCPYTCDQCGKTSDSRTPFCRYCGADMRE